MVTNITEDMEDYKEKYENAVNELRNLRSMLMEQNVINADGVINTNLERIFPELKGNDDERIRKHIIEILSSLSPCHFDGNEKSGCIAWLEKQKTTKEALQYLKENHSPSEVSDFQAAMNIAVVKAYNKGYTDGLEKQGGQKPADKVESISKDDEDESMIKDIIAYMRYERKSTEEEIENRFIPWLEKRGEQKEYTFKSLPRLLDMIEPTDRAKAYCQKLIDTLAKEGYNIDAKIVGECLKTMNGEDVPMGIMDEKQAEQNPADKVAPKFKVGDWIVYNDNLYHIGNISLQRYYECLRIDGTVLTFSLDIDSKSHLWTIQDAKDGDVLATDDGGICVFDGTIEEGKYPFAHCGLTRYGFETYDGKLPFTHDDVHPATKEQRDLLFQKMKEAGYEWDAEKKELKKINLIKAEHGKYYYCIKDYFSGGKKFSSKGDTVQALRGWPIMGLEDISEYFLPVDNIQKSAWSEEDEIMLKTIFASLNNYAEKSHHCLKNVIKDEINWLKSLKEKMKGE